MSTPDAGLALHPFRALRPTVDASRLGQLLCPPYDVIDDAERTALLEADPDNAVALILPSDEGEAEGRDRYQVAAHQLQAARQRGLYATDADPALYVYELTDGRATTRGLIGAVELRDPADNVILPHENTMAGPVADRLALMIATESNLEPIYLVYDGGGAASDAVAQVRPEDAIAQTTTPDGITHRLWALTDPEHLAVIGADLRGRRALIADGHHRYATYRELQELWDTERGPGPWDRGLALLVDSSSYGPQVHAIHRVVVGIGLPALLDRTDGWCATIEVADPEAGLQLAGQTSGFAAVLADAQRTVLLADNHAKLAEASVEAGGVPALAELDVTVLHRTLVGTVWAIPDDVDHVGYAHSVTEALAEAARTGGTAVLLRPTPVAAVAAVAAAGGRMPRKSTLFTPKPASGLVMRLFADEAGPAGH
ncbi:DUF1015 domain-containing protein [Jatrophihabitans cynanchi]|jgi:uncharacterized protein (DUF1015 family)|uniref:DUF1015 domain-containing protein n=1 Tax=Jatrophihabitans cynanchi TaxID=2944128 RepID=A0ABY7JWN8_9ACTN|nr:DUF1015 domain-containing protein [Jatrophihabitans sp. SB3-54]WAX56980.1 DUF1015 domain-containing protein [Jatrophihabitans sp. SB3-54]